VLIRMYAYARLEEEVYSIRTWLCIRWPLSLNGRLIALSRTFILTIVELWLLADVVCDPEFYSFFLFFMIEHIGFDLVFYYPAAVTSPCSNCLRHGARAATTINWRWSKKRESCTHSQRYHSSRDRLVSVLIS